MGDERSIIVRSARLMLTEPVGYVSIAIALMALAFGVVYDASFGLVEQAGFAIAALIGVGGLTAFLTSWLQWRPDQGYAIEDELRVMRWLGVTLVICAVLVAALAPLTI